MRSRRANEISCVELSAPKARFRPVAYGVTFDVESTRDGKTKAANVRHG